MCINMRWSHSDWIKGNAINIFILKKVVIELLPPNPPPSLVLCTSQTTIFLYLHPFTYLLTCMYYSVKIFSIYVYCTYEYICIYVYMYWVFRKNCVFFTIHCSPSLAYIAVRDLQSSQRNTSVHLYSHSYSPVIFCTTNSRRVLARERWQTLGKKRNI